MSVAEALERAYAQKLRAGAAFHALQFSRRASRRRLTALATEFSRVAELLHEAASLLPDQRPEGTQDSE